MKSPTRRARVFFPAAFYLLGSLITTSLLTLCVFSAVPTLAQTQARRLILKDGSYQSVTKYEIHGDRVRYFSAERGEWEEVPKELIDWDATDKFEQGRQADKLAPEAVALDKELEAERKATQVRTPEAAPGLRLPDEGGIFLLDTFENQPQLAELQQSGGDVEKNSKSTVLHSLINPLAGARQTIELPGPHAKIQSHTTTPSLYINIDLSAEANLPKDASANAQTASTATATTTAGQPHPLAPTDRFKIIRIDVKNGKRIAGAVKIAVTGKMSTDERLIAASATTMTGGWIQLTPAEPLATGEYAVAEMMGSEGMNIYVWDFGVNPSAPANAFTWKPDPAEAQPKSDQPADLQKREKQ